MTDVPPDPAMMQVQLNPDGVAAPAQRIASQTARVVIACLRSLREGELEARELDGGQGIRFEEPYIAPEDRLMRYDNWLLSKGFHDVAKGIRASLEEAYLFCHLALRLGHPLILSDFELLVAELRRRANRFNFPDLLAAVNADLSQPLTFLEEFSSLQAVRNCLEHRDGIVGAEDIRGQDDGLRLVFPRLKSFFMRDGVEIELEAGIVVDTGPDPARRPVAIHMRRDNRERVYRLGERITFTTKEFEEVCLACHLFANDLGSKLPGVVATGAGEAAPR